MATIQTFTAGQVLTAAQLNTLQGYVGVVQVQSTTKDDTFTSASTTFVDVTGVSVSITPTSASNKVLVVLQLNACNDVGVAGINFRLDRDGTAIAIGAAASNRDRVSGNVNLGSSGSMAARTIVFLDSPASTSALTYKLQARNTAAGTLFVNRNETDSDAATTPRGISTITVLEVTP